MSEGDPSIKGRENDRRLNGIYYSGQARAFGLPEPLDPSKVNGVVYPVWDEPRRDFYVNDSQFGEAQREYSEHIGEALASQEKHALSGVPFN